MRKLKNHIPDGRDEAAHGIAYRDSHEDIRAPYPSWAEALAPKTKQETEDPPPKWKRYQKVGPRAMLRSL